MEFCILVCVAINSVCLIPHHYHHWLATIGEG